MFALGKPELATTVKVAAEVLAQPLEGSVTVIEYIPGPQTLAVNPEELLIHDPPHTAVQLAGLAVPIKVAVGLEHVMATDPPPEATGGVVFVPTVATIELVQVLAVFVTTNV